MPIFKIRGYEVESDTEANANEAVRRDEDERRRKPPKTDYTAQGAKMALEGVGPGERALINLGAGIDSTVQGVKGFFRGNSPERDAEIEAKRTRDSEAADTFGGSTLQVLGEIAPSLLIPGGGYVKGAQGAMNLVRGVNMAKPLATRPGTWSAMADTGIAGALGGLIQDRKSDENAAADVAMGSLAGLVPGAVAGVRSIKDMLGKGGAEKRAAEQLIRVMGGVDEAEAELAKIAGFKPSVTTKNVPLTTAEVTQNADLKVLENAAAAKNTGQWTPFRERQAAERWKSAQEVTRDAPNLEDLMKTRDDVTAPWRERALGRAGKDPFFTAPTAEKVDELWKSGLRSSPAGREVIQYVTRELNEGITPEQLYQVRKTLTGKLNGKAAITDTLAQSVKDQRVAVMQIVESIDQGLNDASKGAWEKYLKKYQNKSGEVNNARASELLRDAWESGPRFGREGQQVPALTGERLRKAVDKFGPDEFGGTHFNEVTESGLRELQENIDKTTSLGSTVRSTGTGGGGSQTVMDTAARDMFEDRMKQAIPIIKPLIDRGVNIEKQVLQDALMNPDRFTAVVSRKLQQGKPLTPTEEAVALALRSISVAPIAGVQ